MEGNPTIVVELSEGMYKLMTAMLESGLFGNSLDEVGTTLIRERLREECMVSYDHRNSL